MYDEIDDYVERNLKNWVARYQPPQDGRRRLMLATSEPTLHVRPKFSQFLSLLINPKDPFERILYPQSEWEMGPALSSMMCQFHVLMSWRVAH
jgi:hypothetical protein